MTIAHLSDLHLSLDHRRENTPRLSRLLEYVSRLSPDHVVVTGDVSWNADERELLLARNIFEAQGLFAPERLTILPGNHDVFGGVHTAEEALQFFARCRNTHFEDRFDTFFRVFHELFKGCLHTSRKHIFPFVKTLGGVALIGLNSVMRHSQLKNPVGSNGLVGQKERDRLDRLLSSGLLAGKRKIVLVHHHFHNPSWETTGVLAGLWLAIENKTMKLKKKRSLLRLLARHRVELVLHGHHHDNCEYHRSGVHFMNGGGSLMGPTPSEVGVNIIRIEQGRMRTEIHRIGLPLSPRMDGGLLAEHAVQIAA